MQNVKFVTASYEASSSREIQGNRTKIEPYLRDGYYVKEERNGYWVLVRPVKVNVTIKKDDKNMSFNMKSKICDYYGRKRISEKVYHKFLEDVSSEKIKFYLKDDELTIK